MDKTEDDIVKDAVTGIRIGIAVALARALLPYLIGIVVALALLALAGFLPIWDCGHHLIDRSCTVWLD